MMLYLKRGADLAREMKWLGSHRYAVVNMGGSDRDELYARYRDVRGMLGFERHAEPEPAPMWAPEGLAVRTAAVPSFGG